MTMLSTLINTERGKKMAQEAGRGNLRSLTNLLAQLVDQGESSAQVKIGSCTGNGSSLNVTIQSNWTPAAVLLLRANGSAIYANAAAIGDGKAFYLRGNASVPQSMGIIASLGIYLQSNGFSLGSTLSVSGKTHTYIAFKGGLAPASQ